ncbi:hypothetical protein [Archangium primigenium]|uniref:hypothetical protein n=1 Tax=[Archangium] primigenium TaxID=2792470 RepID=UPI00195AA576|nr:hypothetical protein [Archangium primigenium]MBM7117612.1 hypothetical protein [Archangium primigenium]
MSCARLPQEDGAVAVVCQRPRKKRPPKPLRPAPPRVDVRRLVVVSVPAPWHVLLALGLCPALCLPQSERYLWAEYVALHVTDAPEDARAFALARQAGVDVPEHPLRAVRQAVVSVVRVARPCFPSAGQGGAMTPWFHGAALLRVEDALVLHPIPWAQASAPCWEPGAELRHEVGRAFKVARTARAHLEAEARQEALHEERAGHMAAELDELLGARLAAEAREHPPAPRKVLGPVVVTRVEPASGTFWVAPAPPTEPDPLAELQRRYQESQQRLFKLAEKYKRYPRSPEAMCPVTGLKGYLCPDCQDYFTWCPGVVPHECARPT